MFELPICIKISILPLERTEETGISHALGESEKSLFDSGSINPDGIN